MKKEKTIYAVTVGVLFVFLAVMGGILYHQCARIKEQQEITQKMSVFYVFDMERAVKQIPSMISINKKYAEKLEALAKEVEEAQAKIQKIQKVKGNNEVSEVYMASLKLKRDNIIEEYQKSVQAINGQLNEVLKTFAQELKAPIWSYKAIVVTTPNVMDITDKVIQVMSAQEK